MQDAEGTPQENRDETATDTVISAPETAAEAPPKRLQPVSKPRREGIVDTNFGLIPAIADGWTAEKSRSGGGFEALSFPSPDGGVDRTRWPMSELTVENLRSRWGPGDYVVSLYRSNGAHYLKKCPMVRINPPAAAPPPSVAPSSFQEALTFMNAAKKEAQDTVNMVVSLAALGGNRAPGGVGEQTIALMLEKQSLEFRLLMEKQENEARRQRERDEDERKRLQREIDDLRRASEEEGSGLAEGAAKGARLFRRGMSIGDFLMSFAAEHPDTAAKVVGEVVRVGGPAALALASKLVEKPAPPPPAPVRRLQPVPRETLPHAAQNAPKRPPPPATGLNAIATDLPPPAKEEPKAPPVNPASTA